MGYDWLSYYKKKRGNSFIVEKRQPKKISKNDNVREAIYNYLLTDTIIPKKSASLPAFIECIGNDFMKYVSSNANLCKVRKLFSEGENPDYNDVNVQQLYLLRYTYAYAFENKELYSWVLNDRKTSNNLSVESIGCGCMVDSWSLQYAAEALRMSAKTIKYKGIDLVHWSYQLGALGNDFLRINAADYFREIPFLESEVYIFPRSIGDFSDKDFEQICLAFSSKKIARDTIYILVSQRKGEKKISDIDVQRTYALCKSISSNHYICTRRVDKDRNMRQGLNYYDSNFDNYPTVFLKLLEQLKERCNCHGTKQICINDCKLGQKPMFYTERLAYNGFKFERIQK